MAASEHAFSFKMHQFEAPDLEHQLQALNLTLHLIDSKLQAPTLAPLFYRLSSPESLRHLAQLHAASAVVALLQAV